MVLTAQAALRLRFKHRCSKCPHATPQPCQLHWALHATCSLAERNLDKQRLREAGGEEVGTDKVHGAPRLQACRVMGREQRAGARCQTRSFKQNDNLGSGWCDQVKSKALPLVPSSPTKVIEVMPCAVRGAAVGPNLQRSTKQGNQGRA